MRGLLVPPGAAAQLVAGTSGGVSYILSKSNVMGGDAKPALQAWLVEVEDCSRRVFVLGKGN